MTDVKKMNLKDYISTFFKGILLGLISVGIPGLSASTIGIIIGVYFVLVESIANVFSDFKSNIKFLLSIIFGYAVGAVGAAYSITILFDHFALITTLAILGFILGSIPDMVVKLRGRFKNASNWIVFGVIVFLLVVYNYTLSTGTDTEFPTDPDLHFLVGVIFMGLVTSATFVIPGVDFAVVFLSLGIYYPFTNMVTQLLSFNAEIYAETLVANLKILGFYLIGYFVGMFLFSKLIKYLNSKYNSQTQFASLAFVCAAPAIVIKDCVVENQSFRTSVGQWIVGIALFLAFFLLMIVIGFLNSRKKTRYYLALWTGLPSVFRYRNDVHTARAQGGEEGFAAVKALLDYMNKKQKITVESCDMPDFENGKKYVLIAGNEREYDAISLLSVLPMPAYIDKNQFGYLLRKSMAYSLVGEYIGGLSDCNVKIVTAEPTEKEEDVTYLCVSFENMETVYGASPFARTECKVRFTPLKDIDVQ